MNKNIFDLINKSDSIIILAHQKPDGDAVGSSLAMYKVLKNMSKKVEIVLQDIPDKFNFLKEYDKIKTNINKSFDLGIILDCSTYERIGMTEDIFTSCNNTVCFDHHITNTKYCNVNYIETNTSSCCEILYYFFKKNNIKIDKEIGECLLIGMLTDTNGYANNNVSEKTLQMAQELIQIGVNHYNIYNNVLSKKTKAQYELDNIARSRLVFYHSGKISYTYITKEDTDKLGTMDGDHVGIVDIGRNIEGVEVSLFIHEDDGYRFSLRSNGRVDVSMIAKKFNGGGHKWAAGGIFTSNYEETKNKIIEEIKNEIG